VKATADTNVLVRALVQDHPEQAHRAANVLLDAGLIAVTLPTLCELTWVLRKVYGFSTSDITQAIVALIAAENVELNRLAAEAGLATLEAGGDFADGVIAFEGRQLGGDIFVSFDKRAVKLLKEQGYLAMEL
jgi:predicted nucleic-acid-binding protein